ncbi:MAG TPA: L,D-transpeptidase family protein [Xanthobacteraceae bacterium]|jgi:murein L,D-transpeptidase YcbB/YkuD
MTGVRLDRFLASTAIALLLCAGGAAWAGSSSGDQDAATETTSSVSDQPAAVSSDTATDPATEAAPAPPAESTSAIPSQAKTTEPADEPAAATEQPAEPKAPAIADTPPAHATPAAANGGDEVPAPAASTSPGATPNDSAAGTAPTAVADGNTAITEKLRELANGKFDRMLGGKKERAAFEAYYASRDYAPLWLTDGKPNARAQAAIAYLGQVDADGLEPSDYPTPNFASLSDPAALAEAELRLSLSLSAYAHHAAVGRVHWTRVSGDISYDLKVPAPGDVLAKIGSAHDVSEALASYEPQSPGYLALKAKLAELRGGKEEAGQAPIPNGPAIKIGAPDARVAQLRQRLNAPGDDNIYDKTLAEAVKRFQQEHELKPTGLLTPATIDALNGRQPDRPIDIIVANMERWRWMPHDLGRTYVMVNLPDFTLRVVHDNKELWKTKIVDGKPNMPTPIMSAEMKFITVNPTWNVPPSIVAREYMPALQQDPTVLTRMGLSVSTNPDGTVHISQPPGERNALGRLRFNFPNKFLVYQHDTPEKHLFALEKRAFSHGCMRVQDPVKYAEVLLSVVRPHEGYTEDRIRRMFGTSETDISFPNFIPVHLTYQTAFVDENGKLQFRDDVYGRDKVLLSILKSDERKVADTPIERRENTVKRELLAMPEQSGFFGGRSYPGGGDFFSRLFGPPADQAPVRGQRRRSAQTTDSNFSERWR